MKRLFYNAAERRLRAGWRIAGQVVCMLAFWIPLKAALIASGAIGAEQLREEGFTALVAAWGDTLLVAMLQSFLAGVASVWLAARFLDKRKLSDMGFHRGRRWWSGFAFGFGLGGLLMTGVFCIEWLLGWVRVEATFSAAESAGGRDAFWVNWLPLLLTFVMVGVYEELLARGYWLKNTAEGLACSKLNNKRAVLIAWLASSLVFGLGHVGNPNASWVSLLGITGAGLLLGLGYVLTGELSVPIGLHISWNLFQGCVYGFPVSGMHLHASIVSVEQTGPEAWTGGAFGPEAGLIGLVTIAVGILCILAWVRWRSGGLSIHAGLAKPELRNPPPSVTPALPADPAEPAARLAGPKPV
jgi:membrane protease YdiL (CAAX protease family)